MKKTGRPAQTWSCLTVAEGLGNPVWGLDPLVGYPGYPAALPGCPWGTLYLCSGYHCFAAESNWLYHVENTLPSTPEVLWEFVRL